MLQNNSSSLQVMLIRQIQIDEGNAPCYATKSIHNCMPDGCCWSHDCYSEQTDSDPVAPQLTYWMQGTSLKF